MTVAPNSLIDASMSSEATAARMVPTTNTVDLDRSLPNSRRVIYPDAGHGGIFQHHRDFVATTLDFLDR